MLRNNLSIFGIPANQIYNKAIQENILVQGVIDLYYIDSQDDMVLVDYKTDHIQKSEQELVEKYSIQLQIYKKALEEALGEKVKKVAIYSVYLNKTIQFNL